MTIDEAKQKSILLCEVGSKAYGTSVDDNSDIDLMGVQLEPLVTILTKDIPKPFVWRDAAQREGTHNAKSKAGDLDLKLYGLKHFVRLALNGNPDVLMLLYTKPLSGDARGMRLQGMRDKFISKDAIPKFMGYLNNQRLRLLGEKGQKDVHRPDLVEKYGYDTKYAMQMIRLGLQGLELAQTAYISIPMPADDAEDCKDIRLGKWTEADCIDYAKYLEAEIARCKGNHSPLPDKADADFVWDYTASTYLEHWKCQAFDASVQAAMAARVDYPTTQREGESL